MATCNYYDIIILIILDLKWTGSFFNPGPYAGFLVSVWPATLGMYLFKD